MTAAQRIDAALAVALETVIAAANAGEITPHDAAQVVDIVSAAIRTVQTWAPEWETSNG
jgi:hypothetical protein